MHCTKKLGALQPAVKCYTVQEQENKHPSQWIEVTGYQRADSSLVTLLDSSEQISYS